MLIISEHADIQTPTGEMRTNITGTLDVFFGL